MAIKFIPEGQDFQFPTDFGFTKSSGSSMSGQTGNDDGTYLAKARGGPIKKAMGGPIGAPPPVPVSAPPMNGAAAAPGNAPGGILNRATISMPASDAKQLVSGAAKVGAIAGAQASQLAAHAKGRMGPPRPMAGPPPQMQGAMSAPPGGPGGPAMGGAPPMMARGGHLTTKQRDAMPAKEFALPNGRYPINDANHARNALARVSGNGTSSEKATVRAAVHRKFPAIGKG